MTAKTAIVWFRQDLRLKDHPALHHAATQGYQILPVYILDDENAGEWCMGGASRWWLHQSLQSLNRSLKNNLHFYKGRAEEILPSLVTQKNATAVFWNRCYEPWQIQRDAQIKTTLKEQNTEVLSFNASLLWEPWDIKKDDGTPYKVFTPFYRNGCLKAPEPPAPLSTPSEIFFSGQENQTSLHTLGLLPKIKWYEDMEKFWDAGESAAQERFRHFLHYGLKGYKEGRNRPDLEKISRLSPYLHFGEISVRDVWHAVRSYAIAHGLESDTDTFCSELGWREFSHALLYQNPDLPESPLNKKFSAYPWEENKTYLELWQHGQTGIPIVDAGMRQLWKTGWMHNRVRMITASFLVKNLRLHWRHGENWFWDTLVDADLANNAASWQWVAGCGADAAPYFRIFNPVTQGEKFDPDGAYVREFVPELKNMPNTYIHKPWEAPKAILNSANISLGRNYPLPIVDLKKSREKALEGYKSL